MWKYWLTIFGWKLNACFHASGLGRLPLLGRVWSTSKRLIARWLASGHGVPARLGGQPTNIHPFTIAYSIHSWEPYTAELFQNALKPCFTVLDIGAHQGYFSLFAARCVGKDGVVYAFEPTPQNFQILRKNIELNHFTNVIPVNKAIGDSCTTVPFFLSQHGDVNRNLTAVGGSLFPTQCPNEFTVPVECITIDAFLAGKPVDVVKMDIEGGEPYALEGMKKTLSESREIVLFVEFAPDLLRRAGVKAEDFLAQLDKAGFECQLINEERRCLQPTKTNLIPEEGFPDGYCNLYCIKKATTE